MWDKGTKTTNSNRIYFSETMSLTKQISTAHLIQVFLLKLKILYLFLMGEDPNLNFHNFYFFDLDNFSQSQ